jgi:hypothetical protein
MTEFQKEVEATASPTISTTASSDRDDNYAFYRQHQDIEYTPEEARKTLRKIDLQLIPLLFVIYMIQVCWYCLCCVYVSANPC